MGATFSYTKGAERALSGNLDFVNDTIRALLITKSYTPNPDDDFVGDGLGANEVSGGNYARVSLTGKSVTIDDAADDVTRDADDLTFGAPPSGIDLIGVGTYKQVGGDDTTPGDDPALDFGAFGGGDVTAIDTANDEITIAGDETANFSNGDSIELKNHPTHTGTHTLNGAPSLSGGDTVLPVGTDLTDGTVQGTVYKILTTDGNKVDYAFDAEGIARIEQPA